MQADTNVGVGIVAQYGGEVSVANFTDSTYGGYNYVYAGGHEAGSTGLQASASASVGDSLFVGYNDSKDPIAPNTFEGATYSSSISADFKVLGSAGVSLSKFSSVKTDSEKGWKGISVGINIGVGASANLMSIGKQVSSTLLINTVKPTSQRSMTDRISNSVSPIISTLVRKVTGN